MLVAAPTPLTGNWDKIDCGGGFSYALSGTKLFSAGRNTSGQLGQGYFLPDINYLSGVDTFRPVSGNGNYSDIFCGYGGFAFALSSITLTATRLSGVFTPPPLNISVSANKMFSTGINSVGNLGLGTSGNNSFVNAFQPLTGYFSRVVCGDDYAFALSATLSSFVVALSTVFFIGPDKYRNVTLSAIEVPTKKWFVCGSNYYGQLGLSKPTYSRFIPITGDWDNIVCGSSHTFAQSANTKRWFSCGQSFYGQLGRDTWPVSNTVFGIVNGEWDRVVCGDYYTYALSANTNR